MNLSQAPQKNPAPTLQGPTFRSAAAAMAGCLGLLASAPADEGPGIDNRSYSPAQVGSVLSWVDTGAAISGVSMWPPPEKLARFE